MPDDLDPATLRLSDLQRARAAGATLKNLLSTLTEQTQTCAKLAVFEYEADSEGHHALAMAFRGARESEQASFNALLGSLRWHLNELEAESPRTPTQAASR